MTSRWRAFRTSSRRVRSSSSTPAFAASCFSASTNGTPSRCMTKLKTSPPRPHPKQCQLSRAGVTTNDGVFSPWNGQRPLYVAPAFFRLTDSPTTSTTFSRLFTSAATPTANPHPPRRCLPSGPSGDPRSSPGTTYRSNRPTVHPVARPSRQPREVPNMTDGVSSLDTPVQTQFYAPLPLLTRPFVNTPMEYFDRA